MASSDERIETHLVIESSDNNAVDLLQGSTGLGKQRIKQAMTKGAVWLTRGKNTQRLRRAKRVLRVGDELHLYYDTAILAETPPEPTLIADCDGYSVWHKPCGLRSQGSKWGDHCTLVRWAERHLQPERPAFTVHRLDRAASGLMMVAHSKRIAAALATLFKERRIEKRYRALVRGSFPLQAEPVRVDMPIDDREAISEIQVCEAADDGVRSLLDIRIETGRKHQIRRHLQALGHPIVGDRLYGNAATDGVDLQLTAYKLAFLCPVTNKPVEYRAIGYAD